MAVRTLEDLRRGARIHSLVYAARLAKNPDRPYDVAWQRLAYSRANARGARGMVSFSKVGAVGVFFDAESADAPERLGKPYRLEPHFEGIPTPLLEQARREVLPSFEASIGSSMVPVVTGAFWSDAAGAIVSARPWARVQKGGAHLVVAELGRPQASIKFWCSEYGLLPEQAKLVRALFAATTPAAARVNLTPADRAALGIILNQVTRELLLGANVAVT